MGITSRAPRGLSWHTLAGYIRIARVDHWIKNLFVLPGFVVALSIEPGLFARMDWLKVILGIIALCLITSSNYVLNEILDAASDRIHPFKSSRPVAAGQVNVTAAYAEWLLLMGAGLALATAVSAPYTFTLLGLWIAGCLYNVPPFRTKDIPYLDVISEAVNNPLRMLAGWYLTRTVAVPITTLLVSYWLVGCYFMAVKRYSEYRELSGGTIRLYRRSFHYYSERSLLASILFYGSQAMLFLGAFIVRYRLELILSFPLVALVMSVYLWLAFRPHSPVQHPEGLYREPLVLIPVAACALVMTTLLFVDVPLIYRLFPPTKVGF
jgi:decaprenyl-phosphate phosphoribosyltransferase